MLRVVIDDMRATIPFIRDRFERFNAQMFGGELPWLPIGLSRARTFVGMCSFWVGEWSIMISNCGLVSGLI